MATVKAVIDTRFSKRKNGHQILIRVQHTSKKKEDIGIGEYLPKLEYFDKSSSRVKKRKNIEYERINTLILEKILLYQDRVKGNQKATPLKSKESVLAEFERVINKLDAEGKYNSKRIISYAYKYLTDFLHSNEKNKLDIYEIDDVFLDEYKIFLLKNDLKSGTIKAYVEKLRTIHNLIVERLNITKQNPFKNFKVEREETKNTLSEEFLNKFINYIPKSKERIFYKQIFLSQFFLQGSRISDMLNLTYQNLVIENHKQKPEIDNISTTSDIINYGLNMSNKTDYSKVKFHLDFKAFKTKQHHVIPLSNKAIIQLRYFLDKDLQLKYLDDKIYDKEFRTYVGKEIGKVKIKPDDVETFFSEKLGIKSLKSDEYKVLKLKELIIEQAQRTPNKCIFHDWSIDGLKGNDLKRFVQSKTTYINKSLKSNETDEYYKVRLKEHLSTHSARHLFAIIYYTKKRDIYGLSKLLFHKKVNTTQEYLKRLNVRLHNEIDALDFYDNF